MCSLTRLSLLPKNVVRGQASSGAAALLPPAPIIWYSSNRRKSCLSSGWYMPHMLALKTASLMSQPLHSSCGSGRPRHDAGRMLQAQA
jgi:hypothetical protein